MTRKRTRYTPSLHRGRPDPEHTRHNAESFALRYPKEKRDIAAQYFRDAAKHPRLSLKEELALGRRIQQGDEKARERLILANLWLVIALALKMARKDLPLLDLINEGNKVLVKKAGHYNPSKKSRFATYISSEIRHQMRVAILEQGRAIPISRHHFAKTNVVMKAEQELADSGKTPDTEMLAAKTGLTYEQTLFIKSLTSEMVSLDEPIREGESTLTRIETLCESKPTPREVSLQNSQNEEIRTLLTMLPPKEQEILKLHYGIDAPHGETETLEQISQRFQVTRERIRQIESSGLHALRKLIDLRRQENRHQTADL